MDVRERLHDLAAGVEPEPLERGIEVFGRARRRRTRRRVGGGAVGVLAVALVVAVAWPGVLPGGLVIGEVADRPSDDGLPVLDLPDDWQQVRVGGAVLGVPGAWEVRELGPDDPYPLGSESATAFLVRGGWPTANDRVLEHPYVGRPGGTPQDDPVMLGAAISEVGDPFPVDGWQPTTVAGHDAEIHVHDPDDVDPDADPGGVVPNRVARYRVPALDLHLEFTSRDADIGLVEEVLATVTPVGPDAPPLPPAPPGTALDVPEGWRALGVADAVVGVPPGVSVELPGHDGRPLCPHAASLPTIFHVLDGIRLRERFGDQFRCPVGHPDAPTVTAARLSLVPDEVVDDVAGATSWTPVSLAGGVDGEVLAVPEPEDAVDRDEIPTDRAYRFPALDLWLYVTGDVDVELAVLATLAPVGADAPVDASGRLPGTRTVGQVEEVDETGTRLALDVGTCGEQLVIHPDETPDVVRLTVVGRGSDPDGGDCLDLVEVELGEPLGDRRLVDATTGTELELFRP